VRSLELGENSDVGLRNTSLKLTLEIEETGLQVRMPTKIRKASKTAYTPNRKQFSLEDCSTDLTIGQCDEILPFFMPEVNLDRVRVSTRQKIHDILLNRVRDAMSTQNACEGHVRRDICHCVSSIALTAD
jgi:hypothetical protein